MKLLLIALLSSYANAGWWTNWCERHLIADDPYQFETVSSEYIINEISLLETRQPLSVSDERLLRILKHELQIRNEGTNQ